MRLYLAGPMRGYPAFNFPAFAEAAQTLRAQSYVVWSPHENERESEWAAMQGPAYNPEQGVAGEQAATLRFFMQVDLPAVLASDGIAVLDGWQASAGCQVELYVAFQCGIPVYRYTTGRGIDLDHPMGRFEHPHISRKS